MLAADAYMAATVLTASISRVLCSKCSPSNAVHACQLHRSVGRSNKTAYVSTYLVKIHETTHYNSTKCKPNQTISRVCLPAANMYTNLLHAKHQCHLRHTPPSLLYCTIPAAEEATCHRARLLPLLPPLQQYQTILLWQHMYTPEKHVC